MIEVNRLVENGDIDYIIIESSGISEPIPVAQTVCKIIPKPICIYNCNHRIEATIFC
jgi:G3E family GTPase